MLLHYIILGKKRVVKKKIDFILIYHKFNRFIVNSKNKYTLSTPGRCGFAAYTPKCDLHSNRTDAECPSNYRIYYKSNLSRKSYLENAPVSDC